MTDWEKFLERRKANIGFITRAKAFRNPSALEMNTALAIEIKSWQSSIGKKTFKVGPESPMSKMAFDIFMEDKEKKNKAIEAYIQTPIDKDGILESQGIDVDIYKWREVGIFRAFFNWIVGRKVRRKYD
jgi:hypothetical protein